MTKTVVAKTVLCIAQPTMHCQKDICVGDNSGLTQMASSSAIYLT